MSIDPAIIQRAYRLRAYPKPKQAHILRRLFGARGRVWNWALYRNRETYLATGKHLGGNALSKELTQRRHGAWDWLQALPVEPFAQTLRDYDKAGRPVTPLASGTAPFGAHASIWINGASVGRSGYPNVSLAKPARAGST